MTETRTGDVEPGTAAGRSLAGRMWAANAHHQFSTIAAGIFYDVALIEQEARRLVLAEGLDVERLATMLGDWVRVRDEHCGEPSPCDHDRTVAQAILASEEARKP